MVVYQLIHLMIFQKKEKGNKLIIHLNHQIKVILLLILRGMKKKLINENKIKHQKNFNNSIITQFSIISYIILYCLICKNIEKKKKYFWIT